MSSVEAGKLTNSSVLVLCRKRLWKRRVERINSDAGERGLELCCLYLELWKCFGVLVFDGNTLQMLLGGRREVRGCKGGDAERRKKVNSGG